jgi:hypothetical protein
MWHRLRNLFLSLNTYQALSPDLRVRQQVNRALSNRPVLNSDQWFETFYQSQGVAPGVGLFAYRHLEQYSGIEMGRVWPTDRLNEDLCWIAVCWFDWERRLCHDISQQLGVDLSECLEDWNGSTIGELVVLMDQAFKGASQKSPVSLEP